MILTNLFISNVYLNIRRGEGRGGLVNQRVQLFKIKDFKALIVCMKINEFLLQTLLSVVFISLTHLVNSIPVQSDTPEERLNLGALSKSDHCPVGRSLKML